MSRGLLSAGNLTPMTELTPETGRTIPIHRGGGGLERARAFPRDTRPAVGGRVWAQGCPASLSRQQATASSPGCRGQGGS